MDVRALLGSLQLPVALLGAGLVVVALWGISTIPSPPPGSEGFAAGLALLVLYVLGWIGSLVLSFGLAVHPRSGYGISFNRYQRGLFVLAGIAGLTSAIGPFVAFGLLFSYPSLIGIAWLLIMGIAVFALAAGLLWRGAQAVQNWRSDGTSAM